MFFSLPSLPPFSVRVVPRTLVFKQPAGTSRGVYTERRVWYIIIYGTHEGRRFTGVGECAPLFDLSCDYDAGYEVGLHEAARQVEARGGDALTALRCKPSVLFGFETAMLSAAASLRGYYRRLFDTPFTDGGEGIARDVDEQGRLVVECADGAHRVFTGEVSVRGIYGAV